MKSSVICESDNGGPIQFLDRASERGGGRSFMAAANRFLGANHTAAAAAAVHPERRRRRRSYGSNSGGGGGGGGGGSINAIVASFARSFDSEQSKCSEMSRPICRLRRPRVRPPSTVWPGCTSANVCMRSTLTRYHLRTVFQRWAVSPFWPKIQRHRIQ